MITNNHAGHTTRRFTAAVVAASLALPVLAGCSSSNNNGANLPPIDDTRGTNVSYTPSAPSAPQEPRHGMTTGQKVALVAGAAALYWLYKHQKDKQGNPVQYYQSKNGRIYY